MGVAAAGSRGTQLDYIDKAIRVFYNVLVNNHQNAIENRIKSMEGKAMKNHLHRILALVMAFVLVLGLLPTGLWLSAAAEENVYVLDASADLQPMNPETKADGDTDTVGTDGYFTLIYAKKTKIDSSTKSFEDGYKGTQRFNFQSATDVASMVPAIKFTTSGAATITLWWASGGNGRQFAIYDEAGNILSKTEAASVKNDPYMSSLKVDAAGTYFLGVPDGSNYLFKMEVAEQAATASSEYTFTASKDLTASADKEAVPEGALTADGYFTLVGKATKRTESDGVTVKSVELAKNETGAISFTVSGSAEVVMEVSSNGGSNTSTVAIYNAAGETVPNKEGIAEVTTTSRTTLTYSLEAGTYRILSPESSYGRGVRVYSIHVVQGGQAPERNSWDSVAAPVISSVVQNGGELEVTVDMPIGPEGADSLVVAMLSADGKELKASTVTAAGQTHSLPFAPVSSGTYYISAVAKRTDEEDKPAAENYEAAFVLPLAVPCVILVHNEMGGGLTAVWTESREATVYEVSCTAADGTVVTETTTQRQYTFSGLTVGQEYSICVTAIRGEERTAASAPAVATSADEAKIAWNFVRYGESTNDANNGYSVNEDGTVTVWSEGGKGKVQPDSTDGLAFYYTAVPTTHNFTLRTMVHVDSWKLSNGQEGFGLLATDRLGEHGNSAAFWNNQYMLGLTKIEYKWAEDSEMVLPIDSTEGLKFSMKLGLGVIGKTGLTPESMAYTLTMPEGFVSEKVPMDLTATEKAIDKGTYNIVGNATEPVDGTLVEITDFILEIQKNNTGYFVTYYDLDGNVIHQHKSYGADALNQLDDQFVYVGFFASRNARATFQVMEFSTILASEDAPAEEKPVEKIEPVVYIISADAAQSTDYELTFMSNVDGTALIRVDDRNTDMKDVPVKAGQWVTLPVKITADNITKISVSMTPDPDQDLGEGKELTGFGSVGAEVEVIHTSAFEARENLYVSPNGYSTGDGSRTKPLDIYTAVNVARPGQTIVLLEGTYLLEKSVKIQRGIDGTEEKPIRMVADPGAKTRPVLDFQQLSVGVVHGGDWWFFYGFDVTHTQDATKGFQISGNHNVLDNIHAYHNGDTGIQISRLSGYTDLDMSAWPAYNLILNCTSYGNADAGYENADGFAAKLTCGEGNVFDGCVAYNNADDGWDMYAKVETGKIGSVIVRNCVAYSNGYLEDGTVAGNGNGFKLGGSSISGKHQLINCYAFWNLSKGIDSNSCPDIIVENCISYNNGTYNVAFYTNLEQDTAFVASGIISFKDGEAADITRGENLKPRGTQNEVAYKNDTTYYWDGTASKNASGAEFTADMFASLEFKGIARNADGTIDMQGFLSLTDAAPADAGARMTGTPSAVVTLNNPDQPQQPDDPVVELTDPSDPVVEPTDPDEPSVAPSVPVATDPADDPAVEDPSSFGGTVLIVLVVAVVIAAAAVTLVLKKKKMK